MDGSTLLSPFAFKVGQVIKVMAGSLEFEHRHGVQERFLGRQGGDELEVFQDIRHHVQAAAGGQGTGTLAQEVGGEEAAFVVPFLPPGIGIIDVDGLKGARGHIVLQERSGVGMHQPDVRQAAFGNAISGKELVFPGNLDAQEVAQRTSRRRGYKEKALAKADFHLDGMVIAKDGWPMEACWRIGRSQ
jgi:hypothetical protein